MRELPMIHDINTRTMLWATVDAPLPPEWIIEHANSLIDYGTHTTQCMNSNFGDEYKYRDLYCNGKVYKTAFNNCKYLNEDSHKWLRENVSEKFLDIRMSFTLPGLEKCGPHTDSTRDYVMIYVVKPGGDNHETVFYKENGVDDLVRAARYTVDDYENVERIGGRQLPFNTWTLLHAKVLHSVENIVDGRVTIQCAINDISDLKFSETCVV